MKKYVYLLLVMTLTGLLSCGDDDKPVIPELKKLTKIVCNKAGDQTPLFSVAISYSSDGKLSSMQFAGGDNLSFVYLDNKFKVTNLNNVNETAEYVMSGNVIIDMSISKANPYASSEVYESDKYSYEYEKANLKYATWTTRWPKEEGGYEERTYKRGDVYTWENGNVTLFTQDKNEMRYEYDTRLAPKNFPLRVIPSFEPVGFQIVSPINLLYGNQSRYLPKRSYSYSVPGVGENMAEYTYSYNVIGDYVVGMTILEKINPIGGKEKEENTYEYSFTYDFEL